MRTATVTRKVSVSALVALALLAGALLIATPKASASMSECPSGAVCIWKNSNFTGPLSIWAASETGCHTHEANPEIRSGYNRSGHNVQFGGQIELESGLWFEKPGGNAITGQICW
jgi:Peptidase inhibitor family I36